MKTDVELVEELEKRNLNGRYDEIINKAVVGTYHDFKSDEATPKMQLIIDLSEFPELEDIAEAVKEGAYDEPPF